MLQTLRPHQPKTMEAGPEAEKQGQKHYPHPPCRVCPGDTWPVLSGWTCKERPILCCQPGAYPIGHVRTNMATDPSPNPVMSMPCVPVAGRPGRVVRSWFDPRVAELREGGEKIVHCAGLGDIDTGPLGDLDECAGQAVQFQGLAGQPVLQH